MSSWLTSTRPVLLGNNCLVQEAEASKEAHQAELKAAEARIQEATQRAEKHQQEVVSERTRSTALQSEVSRVEGNLK